jgi:DNA-binding transcriptional LysR family regulator
MDLNPRRLEAFRLVMIGGSMTVAAEMLKVSQPAVSRLIKDLEGAIGMRLFRREGNRLIAGREAQILFAEVDRFHVGMERMARVARDLRSARTGSLRVASMTALALTYMTEGLRRFRAEHADVEISLEALNSRSVLQAASTHQIDIGFMQIGGDYPGLEVIQVPHLYASCMVPARHPFARRSAVRLRDLEGQSLIAMGRNSPLRARVDLALASAKVECARPIETSLGHSACGLVAEGQGIAIVDPFTAAHWAGEGLVRRRMVPPIPFEFSMVLPAHRPRSAVVGRFIDVMSRLFREKVAGQG